jgi:NAD(P)-dependent dehydrogenase (short-subunit alcohol dehydrogenase family)
MFDYHARPGLLEGRIILVTGAGRGIGAAAARTLAAYGARVILLGRTEARLNRLRDELTASGALPSLVVPLDLATARQADYDRLAASLEDSHGRLDGLLHNASLLGPRVPVRELDAEAFDAVMQVNVGAVFRLTRALLPLLQRSADASIVFTSSSVGRKGRAGWGAYAVSKFATEGLMQVLADELGESAIRANSVNPGATRTDMRAEAYPDEDPARNPEPMAIMPVYLYLLGPDSAGVNGQALNAR